MNLVMQEIIERAIVSEEFRKKLFENSDVIAKEYKLDSEKTRLLRNVNQVSIEQFVGDMDRITLGW